MERALPSPKKLVNRFVNGKSRFECETLDDLVKYLCRQRRQSYPGARVAVRTELLRALSGNRLFYVEEMEAIEAQAATAGRGAIPAQEATPAFYETKESRIERLGLPSWTSRSKLARGDAMTPKHVRQIKQSDELMKLQQLRQAQVAA